MFSLIWGYWGTKLYSQKQQNHKSDRSLPKFYDLKDKIAIGGEIAIKGQPIILISDSYYE